MRKQRPHSKIRQITKPCSLSKTLRLKTTSANKKRDCDSTQVNHFY